MTIDVIVTMMPNHNQNKIVTMMLFSRPTSAPFVVYGPAVRGQLRVDEETGGQTPSPVYVERLLPSRISSDSVRVPNILYRTASWPEGLSE
jgi:hypothetical protein